MGDKVPCGSAGDRRFEVLGEATAATKPGPVLYFVLTAPTTHSMSFMAASGYGC